MLEETMRQQVWDLSLHELYLKNQKTLTQLPKHQIWQSPLLFPDDMSDFEELARRIKKAGSLWLKNRDLIHHNVLIITHKTAWISYIFQRIQAPNQSPVNMIIPRRLLREGIALPPYPLIFQEFVETLDVSQIEFQWKKYRSLHN